MITSFSVRLLAVLLAVFLSSPGASGYISTTTMHEHRGREHTLVVTEQTDIIGTWELIRSSGDIRQLDSYSFFSDGSFRRMVITQNDFSPSCPKAYRRDVVGTFVATSDKVTIDEASDSVTTTRDRCSPENEGKVVVGTADRLVLNWQVRQDAGMRMLDLGTETYTEAEAAPPPTNTPTDTATPTPTKTPTRTPIGTRYKVYLPLAQR